MTPPTPTASDDPTDAGPGLRAGVPSGPVGSGGDASRRAGGFAALHFRNYRMYFYGQLTSVIGTWMQSLALSWLVLTTLHGSALDLGLVNALNFGPVLVFGLYAGVIADRFNKRDVVNATQGVNMLLAALQAVFIIAGTVSLTQVFLFASILGVSNAFNQPARQALTSELVDRSALLNAISLNSAVFNTGRIVGPSLAGVLVWQFGPATCFAINAACYVVGIVFFRFITLRFVRPTERGDAIAKLREGLVFARTTESVLLPTIMIGFVATFAMNFNVWVPLLATRSLHLGSSGLGVLTASLGVGSLLGALNLAFSSRRPTRQRLYRTAMVMGAVELLLALVSARGATMLVVLPVLAAAGFFMSTTSASANTIVQSSVPDALRGRVMSVYMTVFSGSIPLGSLLTGALAERLGAPAAIGIGGGVAGLAAAMILIVFERRGRRHSLTASQRSVATRIASRSSQTTPPVASTASSARARATTYPNLAAYAPADAADD